MKIEVFRAGNAAADAAGITASDLADLATFDCAAHPVPCVIGHPMTDTPANGAVKGFTVEGNVLFADVPETDAAFAPVVDGIKSKSILNRSMMFFGKSHRSNPTPGKLAPKHLGFLGGSAPGIPGMPALSQCFGFAADDTLEITGDAAPAVVLEPAPTGVVQFSEAPAAPEPKGTTVTDADIQAEKDKLAAEKTAHAAEVAAFAAERKTARETVNAGIVAGLVKEGKVLPADEKDLLAAFNAVDGGDVIAFASDATKTASPVSIIAAVFGKAGKAVPAVDGGKITPDGDAPAFAAEGDSAAALAKVRAERNAKFNK